MFFQGSRYEDTPEHTIVDATGRAIRYKLVRLIPPTPAHLAHAVAQNERLDHIAFLAYRDPERFWRICDANVAMWPPDLVSEPSARILIPPAKG
jgi:hypothetical protein